MNTEGPDEKNEVAKKKNLKKVSPDGLIITQAYRPPGVAILLIRIVDKLPHELTYTYNNSSTIPPGDIQKCK